MTKQLPLTREINSKIVRAYTSETHVPGVPSTLVRALVIEGVFDPVAAASDEITGEQVLALPMDPSANDANASTVREYLQALLLTLWEETEGFSGKRPLGNSDWVQQLWIPLLIAGVVEGSVDAWGTVDEIDEVKADRLIKEAIQAL